MARAFKKAIVVGASSGIGEHLVRGLVKEGARVAAVARRKPELEALARDCNDPGDGSKVLAVAHDVCDFDATPALFDRLVGQLGGLDLLIYNAGVMPRVEENEYSFSKNRQMVEVNLLGAMAWMDPAAAYLEARQSGTLVGISSVAGDRGRRNNPGYHASKAAFSTYLESLRNRLSQHKVAVVTIKPGPVKTAMTEGLKLPLMIPAEECATRTLELARTSTNEGYIPAIWGPIMLAIRHIPSAIFRHMSI
jgi:short-subunit dehydrogenase